MEKQRYYTYLATGRGSTGNELKRRAKAKRVSMAWIMREALIAYLRAANPDWRPK